MKKLFFILICLIPLSIFAQNSAGEKMEAKKVAWLSNKLSLTSEEAKIFWPIYNDYMSELKRLRKQRSKEMISFKKIKEIEDLGDNQIQELIQNDFNFRQNTLDIDQKYYNKFKANLPIKIVGKFYRAQEAFKKEILQQYRSNTKVAN